MLLPPVNNQLTHKDSCWLAGCPGWVTNFGRSSHIELYPSYNNKGIVVARTPAADILDRTDNVSDNPW